MCNNYSLRKTSDVQSNFIKKKKNSPRVYLVFFLFLYTFVIRRVTGLLNCFICLYENRVNNTSYNIVLLSVFNV